MKAFLQASTYIDFHAGNVQAEARRLAHGLEGDLRVAEACYRFVRDEIQHSWDHRREPVTCRASDVLEYGTGYCYAKSHLLAALLRANGIPAGMCYQRLSIDEAGAPYCLHGLNAVYLREFGWYRCDPRGNKAGVAAQFCPPNEVLAFPIRGPGERDLPEIWPEPLPAVVDVLMHSPDIATVHSQLPDVMLWGRGT